MDGRSLVSSRRARTGASIIDALRDRRVFGALPAFRDLTTWWRWLAFLRVVYGLALDQRELEAFQAATGRTTPREGGYPEAVAIVGCQSGKSQIASLIAAYEAMRAPRELGGTERYALLLAQDHRGALRTLFRYASAPFEVSEILERSVVSRVSDSVTLETGVVIAAYPCRPQSVRGLRAVVAVCDELAFFIATDGRATDVEMLRALRTRLATTGGRLFVLSSPYAQSGALWELHRSHYGREDSATLVWQASAPDMNPTLPADYIERMKQDDPEAYRSEVLGEFRQGVSTLFDPEALAACVVSGRRELSPVEGVRYVAFVDPSGGSRDAFTVSIAHTIERRAVVDVVRAWAPPFNPSGVIAEAAALIKTYGCREVTGDRYAGEFPREAFRSHGVEYRLAELDRSRLYLELVPRVNAGEVEIPDDAKLLRELRGLERRRGTAGRDRVDHHAGAHDDRANALAGAVHLALAHSAAISMPDISECLTRMVDEFTGEGRWAQ